MNFNQNVTNLKANYFVTVTYKDGHDRNYHYLHLQECINHYTKIIASYTAKKENAVSVSFVVNDATNVNKLVETIHKF